MVTYIYQYDNQVKGNSVGFARIESRGEDCKITISVRGTRIQVESMNAYLFCRDRDRLRGILIGTIRLNRGVGDIKVLTKRNNIMHTNYALDDMSGILLYNSNTCFLGSEWDGEPISFNIMTIDEKKPNDVDEWLRERARQREEDVKQRLESHRRQLSNKSKQIKQAENEAASAAIDISETVQKIENEDAPAEIKIKEIPVVDMGVEDHEELLQSKKEADELSDLGLSKPDSIISSNEEFEQEDSENIQLSAAEIEYNNNSVTKLELQEVELQESESLEVQQQQLAQKFFDQVLSESDSQAKVSLREKSIKECDANESESLIINPKLSIEFLTSLFVCNNDEDYKELQIEINSLKSRINQLTLVGERYKKMQAERNNASYQTGNDKQEYEAKIRSELQLDQSIYSDLADTELSSQEINNWLTDSPVVKRIFLKYPKVSPFSDPHITTCIRLQPQDIGIFPMEHWILANNSFLLHGYYSYRHLIFVRLVVDQIPYYILGVPGIYQTREQFMANMFGFGQFLSLTGEEPLSGDFGYWGLRIEF